MKRAALGAALGLLFVAPAARADDAVPEGPSSRSTHLLVRLAPEATYQRVYDLSLAGGGLALSLGAEMRHFGVHGTTSFVDLRTPAGLVAVELQEALSLEWHADDGLRGGFGFGLTYLGVHRVTAGPPLASWGPSTFARIGWDFGGRPGPFVLLDLHIQVQASGALPWGPILQVGVRF